MSWETDSKRGGAMSLEDINKEIERQDEALKKRCNEWWLSRCKQIMEWKGLEEKDDNQGQEVLF